MFSLFFKRKTPFPKLVIHNMRELAYKEADILDRIENTHNGPILFTMNSLRCLKDIGVRLDNPVVKQLKKHDPYLVFPNNRGYRRFKAPDRIPAVKIQVRHLFPYIHTPARGNGQAMESKPLLGRT